MSTTDTRLPNTSLIFMAEGRGSTETLLLASLLVH
jgi:hypothetical protein